MPGGTAVHHEVGDCMGIFYRPTPCSYPGSDTPAKYRLMSDWSSVICSATFFANEFAVDTYEIRILRKGVKAPDIFSSSHISDHAAVRRAHALADEGDAVEVWRGTACVYSGTQAAMH